MSGAEWIWRSEYFVHGQFVSHDRKATDRSRKTRSNAKSGGGGGVTES